MEIVTKIAPICLALIMLGLGLGLSVKDFVRVLRVPKDFFVGFFSQLVILPISCFRSSFNTQFTYTNCHRFDDNCSSTRGCYFKCIN